MQQLPGIDGWLCTSAQCLRPGAHDLAWSSFTIHAKYFSEVVETKARLKERIHALDAQLTERAGLYRRLRLPSIPDRQAEILRKLDIEGLLGTDLMVVGTNAFIAYELAAGARFPTGNEETDRHSEGGRF